MAILIVMAMASCKPTEKNYQSAYDAARARREAAAADPDMELMTGGHRLDRSEGGNAFTDSLGNVWTVRRTPLAIDTPPGALDDAGNAIDKQPFPYEWYVVLSRYSMSTNAKAQASDLQAKGEHPGIATDSDGNWYLLLTVTPTARSAAAAALRFMQSNPNYPYIGLDGAPELLRYRP